MVNQSNIACQRIFSKIQACIIYNKLPVMFSSFWKGTSKILSQLLYFNGLTHRDKLFPSAILNREFSYSILIWYVFITYIYIIYIYSVFHFNYYSRILLKQKKYVLQKLKSIKDKKSW